MSTPPSALKRMSGHFLGASKEMEQKISRLMSSASITMSFLTGKAPHFHPENGRRVRAGLIRLRGEFHRPRLVPFADRHERLDDGASAQALQGACGCLRVSADLETRNGDAAFAQQRQGIVFQKAGQVRPPSTSNALAHFREKILRARTSWHSGLSASRFSRQARHHLPRGFERAPRFPTGHRRKQENGGQGRGAVLPPAPQPHFIAGRTT